MPLHTLYCPTGQYSAQDMQEITQLITDIYAKTSSRPGSVGLPDFYVVVNFVPSDNMFVASKKQDRFLRVVVHHLAATYQDNEEGAKAKARFMDKYSETLKPYTLDRGISWEVEVFQSDPNLWRIDGIRPPTVREPERLKQWADAGKALL